MRVSPAEWERVQAKAEDAGVPPSVFMRRAALGRQTDQKAQTRATLKRLGAEIRRLLSVVQTDELREAHQAMTQSEKKFWKAEEKFTELWDQLEKLFKLRHGEGYETHHEEFLLGAYSTSEKIYFLNSVDYEYLSVDRFHFGTEYENDGLDNFDVEDLVRDDLPDAWEERDAAYEDLERHKVEFEEIKSDIYQGQHIDDLEELIQKIGQKIKEL